MEQNDGLLQENMYLSEECSRFKTENTRLENLLETVQQDLTQKSRELTWYRDHNLQRAQEVLRVQTVHVTRYGECFHLGPCQAIRDREHRELELCTYCAQALSEQHRVMLANRSFVWPSGSASSSGV